MRHGLLKSAARELFHRAGGLHLVRLRNNASLRILKYHGFGQTNDRYLRRQCEHLRKYYRLLSMRQVAELCSNGQPFPPNSLAITVDDGYRDFFTIAYPILMKYEIPVTVFLVTDFLDGKSWLWFDQVQYAFVQSRRAAATIPLGSETLTFHLMAVSAEERRGSAMVLTEKAKRLPNSARLRMLRELPASLDVSIPEGPPDEFAPLTWDQAREALSNGIEFGAHTKSHPILSRIEDPADLGDEIEGSKRRIEGELQHPVVHFCYPNGEREDFNPGATEVVKAAGYRAAVTAERGLNHRGADPFLLKRIGAEPELPEAHFRERVAGFRIE